MYRGQKPPTARIHNQIHGRAVITRDRANTRDLANSYWPELILADRAAGPGTSPAHGRPDAISTSPKIFHLPSCQGVWRPHV